MTDKTISNNVSDCSYCNGKGYVEIFNAYDSSDISIEICPKCFVYRGSFFQPAEKNSN